jgi:hypothetical protein
VVAVCDERGACQSPAGSAPSAWLGSTMAIIAPSCAPLKMPCLQGKSRQSPGVRALWGQQWTRLPYSDARKYCPNGGMAFADRVYSDARKYCPSGGMAFADRVGWGTITVPPCASSWWPRTAWLSQKPRVRSSEVVECSQAGAPNLTSDRDGWKIQVRVRTSFAMNVERAHRSVRETA